MAHLQSAEVDDGEAAVLNHLVGDAGEQASHAVLSVVVASNSVDHLDGVHQSWKSILNLLRVTLVKWLNEFLQGLQIFHIIFGLVEVLSDSQLN